MGHAKEMTNMRYACGVATMFNLNEKVELAGSSCTLSCLTSSDADTALSNPQPSFTLVKQRNSHFLRGDHPKRHLAMSQLISSCDSSCQSWSPPFIALVNEQLKTKRDWSYLGCLEGEKKKKEENGNHFSLKPRCPTAPRWRHLKVQVWVSWSSLQLVFWWLPLRYWTGSLAGRGSQSGGSRSPMEAGNQQTTLGKVAQHCFGR